MKTLVLHGLALSLCAGAMAGCASAGSRNADAAPQRLVSEDAHVRIDELRLRGQTQRVTVQPKGSSGPAYEILQPAPGADATQRRDAAGQRVWPVLTF